MIGRPHWDPDSEEADHVIPLSEWQEEVSVGRTRLGYIDWVNYEIEIEAVMLAKFVATTGEL